MCWSQRKRTKYSPVSSGPPTKRSEHLYRPVKHLRRRGRIKVKPRNISQMRKVEKTYLQRIRITQPRRNNSNRAYGVIGPRHRRDQIKIKSVNFKIECLNDKTAREDGKTHLERIRTAQPPANDSKRLYGVIGPRRQHGRIKTESINVSSMQNSGNAYLKRVHAIRSTWRPKKDVRRSDKLTVEYRKQGECWHNVGEYG